MSRGGQEEEELVPLGVSSPVPRLADRRPLGKGVALGALVAVLVGVGALAGSSGRDDPAVTPAPGPTPGAGEPTTSTTIAVPADEPAPAGWSRGAPGPLLHRDQAAEVWTGTELVIWGGDPDGDSGAAYDPAADRWRRIAPAPIPARCQGAATWTGRGEVGRGEMLVWGRACRLSPGPSPGRSRYATAGAAYDPAADRWRVLPEAPADAGVSVASVWIDLIDGQHDDGGRWILLHPISPTLVFSPAQGQWRTLPPVPRPFTSLIAQWTGKEVLVLGTEVLSKGPSSALGSAYRHWTAALDPGTGRWRQLPQPPLELDVTAVFDGRRLIAWDQNLDAVALDPTPGHAWENLPALPFDFTDCSPQGTLLGPAGVFAEHCGQGALWSGTSQGRDSWERIAHPRSLAELPVWTGEEALFWVGRFAGSADGIWLYRPVVPGLSRG